MTEGSMQRFRIAQVVVVGAFLVFVDSATVRMSQMIDWDEPWHGPIPHYTELVRQYPVINLLGALDGLFLLVSAAAVATGVLAAASRRWRTSRRPMLVAGLALGLAGLAVGGWGSVLGVLTQQIEWSAVVGTLAGGCAALAALGGARPARLGEGARRQSTTSRQAGPAAPDQGAWLRTSPT